MYPSGCVLSPIFSPSGILGASFIDLFSHSLLSLFLFSSLASHLTLGSFPSACNEYAEVSPILKAAASRNLVLESACSPVLVLSLSSILEAVACSSFILVLTVACSLVRCFYFLKSRNQLSARPPVTSVWLNGAHWIRHPSLQHWIPWTIIFIKLSPSLAFMASLPSISLTALLGFLFCLFLLMWVFLISVLSFPLSSQTLAESSHPCPRLQQSWLRDASLVGISRALTLLCSRHPLGCPQTAVT